MLLSMVLIGFMSFAATAFGGVVPVYKRELPHYDLGGYNFDGHNSIDDSYSHSHYHHYAHLPAYSTVSYVMANGHKPVSYSGFTNHGRGHHDPGYSVQYRTDGFHSDGHHHHHHHHHHDHHEHYF